MTSTASIFAFLLWRTIAGATRRRLARLREPRYLAGGIVGALYLYFWFVAPLLRGGIKDRQPGPAFHLSAEAATLLLVLAAAALALNASLLWLFGGGAPLLHVTEAEVQFLAPAPLPRHALLHFSLIRTELALTFAAVVVAWVARAFVPHFWQAAVAAFLLLSTMQLHALGLAFWKGRRGEASPATRRLMHGATVAAALLGLSVLAWLLALARAGAAILLAGNAPVASYADFALRARALPGGLTPWTFGFVPQVLLAPFRAVLAPALAVDLPGFVKALPASLAIAAAHYAWVVRANPRHEEAALEGARRGAERVERRRSGRPQGLPSEARRLIVPFALVSEGRPEIAVVWKNLMSQRRTRLAGLTSTWAVLILLAFGVAAAFAAAYPAASAGPLLVVALACTGVAASLALVLPMTTRNDFREDLEKSALLRSWPLSPFGLVAAELAAPLVTTIGGVWALLSFGVAGIAGGRLAALLYGARWHDTDAGPVATRWIVPAVVGLAFLLPALSAVMLVTQNAAVLAFPAWFPPGGRKTAGLEATGTRLIGFAATMLLLAVALLPAALAASLVVWLGWRLLGPWSLVPASALGSLPVWAEVAAGVALLARLFARFDVSSESWS
jgi:ABC-2 type transport system permease protein